MTTPAAARRVTFVVDPSMYGASYSLPGEVYGALDRVVRPDLYYHYATPLCAQRWLDVCADPAYGHAELLDRVSRAMPEVAEALRLDSGGRQKVELLSLGPGDGSVDERMLRGLGQTLTLSAYTGLDFSFELLRRSVNRLAHAPGIPWDLTIHAVCGDFTDLGTVTLQEPASDVSRVFALTGFTFGNYGESELLGDIGRLMREGDYLFLDARLHGLGPLPGDPAPLQRFMADTGSAYDAGSVRNFVLGPVEMATTVDTSTLRVSYEVADARSAIPNALTLVLYCTGLDTTLRLTGERVRRDRLDLAVTTSYHEPDLASWLRGSSFSTVWSDRAGDMAFFLLRR